MTSTTLIAILIVVAAIIFGIFMYVQIERSKKLKRKFGPEYDRVVRERGSSIKAERELEHRTKRVGNFNIHSLTREERDRFAHEWQTTQEHFVDDPRGAVADADNLVNSAMRSCGYPLAGEFEERAADLSVDHPAVVEHYRSAHEIANRAARNEATTEDLRIGFKHYRALFEDLLDTHVVPITGTGARL